VQLSESLRRCTGDPVRRPQQEEPIAAARSSGGNPKNEVNASDALRQSPSKQARRQLQTHSIRGAQLASAQQLSEIFIASGQHDELRIHGRNLKHLLAVAAVRVHGLTHEVDGLGERDRIDVDVEDPQRPRQPTGSGDPGLEQGLNRPRHSVSVDGVHAEGLAATDLKWMATRLVEAR
jgi:hypothetical protein